MTGPDRSRASRVSGIFLVLVLELVELPVIRRRASSPVRPARGSVLVEDEDLVHVLHRGGGGRSRCGASPQPHPQGVLDELLGLGVHGRGGLVEDQDARVVGGARRRTGAGFWPTERRGPPLLHLRVVAGGRRSMEVVGVHGPPRRRGPGPSESPTRAGCSRRSPLKRCTSWRTRASRGAEPPGVPLADVDAVDEHPSLLHVVEPHEQADDGALPAPVAPRGRGSSPARPELRCPAAPRPRPRRAAVSSRRVGEGDALEGDAAPHVPGAPPPRGSRPGPSCRGAEDGRSRPPSRPAGC